MFIQRGHGPGGLPLNVYRGNSRRDKLLGETLEWWDDVENCLNMTSGFLHKALIVYITVLTTITIITTITTVIATITATKVSSSIARKSCFDRNWPWRWEQSHAEWKVFSFSPWTFQHFSIWTFQNMLLVLTHLRKPTLSNAGGPQTGEGSTIPKALTDVWWEVLVDDKLVTTLEITSMVTLATTMATTSVIT